MNFTFGIITHFDINNEHSVEKKDMLMATIDSIRNLRIPKYEIIMVGPKKEDLEIGRYDYAFKCNDIKCIEFDDNIIKKYLNNTVTNTTHGVGFVIPGWITKKKNLITQNAKYENIVFMHDYFMFDSNWYTEFLKFGDKWDVCMNKILNIFNQRHRDWVAWDVNNLNIHRKYLPYDFNDGTKVYISGSYWVAKKLLMEKEPLDECFLAWGKVLKDCKITQCQDERIGEDVEWSLRIRDNYKIVMNKNSIVKHTRVKFTADENFIGTNRVNQPKPDYKFN